MAKNNDDKVYPLGQQFAQVPTIAQKRRSFFVRHRYALRIAIIVGAAVILIAVGVVYLFIHKHNDEVNTQTTSAAPANQTNNDAPISTEAQQTIKQATATASNGGDTTAAVKTLTDAATSTTSTEEKVAYYSQASSIQADAGNYPDAITTGQAAIDASPDDYILYANIAYIYEESGDKTNAIASFQKAIDVFNANPDSEATTSNGGVVGMQAEIDRLKQS